MLDANVGERDRGIVGGLISASEDGSVGHELGIVYQRVGLWLSRFGIQLGRQRQFGSCLFAFTVAGHRGGQGLMKSGIERRSRNGLRVRLFRSGQVTTPCKQVSQVLCGRGVKCVGTCGILIERGQLSSVVVTACVSERQRTSISGSEILLQDGSSKGGGPGRNAKLVITRHQSAIQPKRRAGRSAQRV